MTSQNTFDEGEHITRGDDNNLGALDLSAVEPDVAKAPCLALISRPEDSIASILRSPTRACEADRTTLPKSCTSLPSKELSSKRPADATQPSNSHSSQNVPKKAKTSHSYVSTPFKSPLMSSSPRTPFKSSFNAGGAQPRVATKTPSTSSTPLHRQVTRLRSTTNLKQSPSKPFKSPVIKVAAISTPSEGSPIVTPRRIADMERRLQHLKQADRILKDKSRNSADSLRTSIAQWKTVAREAAEEIWNLVKEKDGAWDDYNNSASSKDEDRDTSFSPFNEGWANDADEMRKGRDAHEYDSPDPELSPPSPSVLRAEMARQCKVTPGVKARRRSFPRLTEHDHHPPPELENEAELFPSKLEEVVDKPPNKTWSLGTMLSTLGIPPDYLGWNDEEGEFLDR